MSSSPAYKPPPPPPSLAPPRPARKTRPARPTPKRRPTSSTPPPASDALQLLRGGAPSPSPQEHDTVEMRLDDPTVEMEAPAERARSVHRKLRAREKRQAGKPTTPPTTPGAEKKRAKANAQPRPRGSSMQPTRVSPPPRERIAGEKSGVRRKVEGRNDGRNGGKNDVRKGAGARSTERRPMARPTTPPPVPPPAAQPPRRSAPPPVPKAAKNAKMAKMAKTARPRPASIAPPPPSARLSEIRRSATAERSMRAAPQAATRPTRARPSPAASASPKVAKVIHIPSREATAQFPLPGFRSDGTNAQVIPLARVAPVDIAVPLVPTTPMPLTRLAPKEAAMPLTQRVFSRLVEQSPGRQDTQQVLLAAPAPFVAEQPDEDLLAPYETSPLRTLRRFIARLLG